MIVVVFLLSLRRVSPFQWLSKGLISAIESAALNASRWAISAWRISIAARREPAQPEVLNGVRVGRRFVHGQDEKNRPCLQSNGIKQSGFAHLSSFKLPPDSRSCSLKLNTKDIFQALIRFSRPSHFLFCSIVNSPCQPAQRRLCLFSNSRMKILVH